MNVAIKKQNPYGMETNKMSNFKPMLAKNAELEKLKFPLAVQKKWDGERLIYKDGEFLSRSLKPITNLWLVEQLKEILKDCPIPLDGEIQVNKNFPDTSGFVRKSDREADFIYRVFDTPIEGLPYLERYSKIDAVIASLDSPKIKLVPFTHVTNMDDLMALHSEYSADPALDGTIVRSLEATYKYGRATIKDQQVMKIKDFEDSEAIILECYERMHNTNEAQTNELGRTFRSSSKDGLVGTGMLAGYRVKWNDVEFSVTATGTLESRKHRWKHRDQMIGQLVKFQFQGVGNGGAPRFPVELGLRDPDDL